ncbi:restriction endonuclease subunit S [Enterococcus faecium]|uniref:Restriction endonuclease subunit S n=1 Tax=Enterococcus faecalis TaxID=1351 RepID=A0A3N3S6F3_ENTFL|nr:restriction endonuclease subunit S [Enterococcus faecium]ROY48536.1 restriction endonuclease subunit S [Enterococcus faecalis]EME3478493.1 restriction endonuclease subunit S [Enterococcus faecium]MCB8520895.1 restriction endonuclease subunit S [Enterococcus faecium]ROX34456.1 restriction endonuclease subunit S [Enterococcus faecium]
MKFANVWGRLVLIYKVLSDFSSYVNERIPVEKLNLNNYISTENMLQNKNGIVKSAKLPTTKSVVSYQKGDILISNIRPYFKKIWYANKNGGCSNDVLVIRAHENYNSKFLYYILSSDNFFDYVMSMSKGTKMPRGDKSAIMQYSIPNLSSKEQFEISETLSSIDKLININSKINHHLVV